MWPLSYLFWTWTPWSLWFCALNDLFLLAKGAFWVHQSLQKGINVLSKKPWLQLAVVMVCTFCKALGSRKLKRHSNPRLLEIFIWTVVTEIVCSVLKCTAMVALGSMFTLAWNILYYLCSLSEEHSTNKQTMPYFVPWFLNYFRTRFGIQHARWDNQRPCFYGRPRKWWCYFNKCWSRGL